MTYQAEAGSLLDSHGDYELRLWKTLSGETVYYIVRVSIREVVWSGMSSTQAHRVFDNISGRLSV